MAEINRADSRDTTLLRLMTEYEIPIRRMCCVYLRDDQLADDAVQETFLKAYMALDSFRGESSEKTWLMRIAVNVCHSMRRTGWSKRTSACPSIPPCPVRPTTRRCTIAS